MINVSKNMSMLYAWKILEGVIFFFCQYNYMTNSPLVTSAYVSYNLLVDMMFFA